MKPGQTYGSVIRGSHGPRTGEQPDVSALVCVTSSNPTARDTMSTALPLTKSLALCPSPTTRMCLQVGLTEA
jgi:hypothetical protein